MIKRKVPRQEGDELRPRELAQVMVICGLERNGVHVPIWRRNDKEPSGLDHAAKLAEKVLIIKDVFYCLEGNHSIETGRRQIERTAQVGSLELDIRSAVMVARIR
jgi:hypothetical protein